jgi:hypothetical protein
MTSALLLPLFLANALSVAFFILALYWPDRARRIAGGGFVVASLVNATLAVFNPQIYVRVFGPYAVGIYKDVIYGLLAKATTRLVLALAVWQLIVAAIILINSTEYVRLGCVAMAIFFLGVSPLGVGSAFPSTLILAAGMLVLVRHRWPIQPETPAPEPRARMKV